MGGEAKATAVAGMETTGESFGNGSGAASADPTSTSRLDGWREGAEEVLDLVAVVQGDVGGGRSGRRQRQLTPPRHSPESRFSFLKEKKKKIPNIGMLKKQDWRVYEMGVGDKARLPRLVGESTVKLMIRKAYHYHHLLHWK
jgi:hypothetical protein